MTAEGRTYAWGHQRRFNSYPEYFRKEFGGRVQKLTLDAGFTCPNRDGSKGRGGCTFCNNNAFNPAYCQPGKSISSQIDEGIAFHKKRYRRADKYLAYFQAYSNTYAQLEVLREKYREALRCEEVIVLVIGTRPDTVDPEILDFIKTLARDYYVVIEYGIESCYNSTLERVNRGHTFEDSLRALDMTASRGIRQGAHFIIGLPGESVEDILAEMKIISGLPISNIKFHQLQIVRNTTMEKEYRNSPGDFKIYDLEEYLELMLKIIELLNPAFVVERIAGESNPGYLVSQSWGLRYERVLHRFEQMLAREDSWQGKRFHP
jgi:radical SAM protein (TIGR01212 family)